MTSPEPGSESHCALCGRNKPLAFHHLIPRTCHRNKWFRKRFSRSRMRSSGIDLCHDCHKHIHTLYTEKELGRNYNTLEALSADKDVAKFVDWVSRQR